MSAAAFVATLVAPAGVPLTQSDIDTCAVWLKQSGATLSSIHSLSAGQAADIFFDKVQSGAWAEVGKGTFDLLIQPAATRRKKLLIADMESTVIEQEMLDELAVEIGVGEHVADITRRAMNGELDFVAALTGRVSLLKGQPASLLDKLASRMRLTAGAEPLLAVMKRSGAKSWLVSGGFTCFVKKIAERLGFDCYYANELIVENNIITGEIRLPILDKEAKKTLLEQACATYGCTLAETLAVGDGANDIPMLLACGQGGGLGVAFHAKPAVRAVIPNQISHSDLSGLIYAQGLG